LNLLLSAIFDCGFEAFQPSRFRGRSRTALSWNGTM